VDRGEPPKREIWAGLATAAASSNTFPVLPTSSKALLASRIAAIPGIPVFAAAIWGPAPVDPSIPSK
jgi:hypothetical protein